MMRTVDELVFRCGVDRAWDLASDVERWPVHLAHYRYVRTLERRADGSCVVAMSANRPFGPLDWPTWWTSEMWTDPAARTVRYRHVKGITTGMDVLWSLVPVRDGVVVTIVHEWTGPRWPLIRRPAAEWVIGPVFVHGIASRTLAGLARAAAQGNGNGGGG